MFYRLPREPHDALYKIEEEREDGYEEIDDERDELKQEREECIEKSRKHIHTGIVPNEPLQA